jgi:hypothetical protein
LIKKKGTYARTCSFPKHTMASLIRGYYCLYGWTSRETMGHMLIYIYPSNARPRGSSSVHETIQYMAQCVKVGSAPTASSTARNCPHGPESKKKKKNVNEQAFISKHATNLKRNKRPHVNMVTALFGTVLSRLTDRPLYSPTQPSLSISLLVVFMIPFHGFIIPSDDTSDNGRRCVCNRVRITS